MNGAPASTPVHVLTGFLGSGKTTLLNHLLDQEALANSAVVVNEFGEISIDHLLVEHSEDNLIELAGGCVCCAVRGDLALTLMDLLTRRRQGRCAPFERIIIETTGLADPNPIGNLLVTDPDLAEVVHLSGIWTTVDSVNGNDTLDNHAEAVRQVALANTLVLTKTDLEAATGGSLGDRISRINPRARIVRAVDGDLPAEAAVFADTPEPGSVDFSLIEPCAGDTHDHQHSAHTDGIESFVVRRNDPVPGAALGLFIEVLTEHVGAQLLRVKGLVALEEMPEQPAVIQGAQHVFHQLDLLEAWPDEDRSTRLVFITQGLEPEWVEAVLDALIWESREIASILADK